MTPKHVTRDVGVTDEPARRPTADGKQYVAVIGIDRYRQWRPLQNAVRDARGVLAAFEELGFTSAIEPILDDAATGDALRHLVTDGLRGLGKHDSLVLFFAGHGHTTTTTLADGHAIHQGYIIPVDADEVRPDGRIGSWLRLDTWLSDVARLQPKHILVILDSCHSGIALEQILHWRGAGPRRAEPLEQLRDRRSRRVITSALGDQLALDNAGPIPGHSLFTGCLLEALEGGLVGRLSATSVTGSEIGGYIQGRVRDYPISQQTPDYGAFELDRRGELIVELPPSMLPPRTKPPQGRHPEHAAIGSSDHIRPIHGGKEGDLGEGPPVGAKLEGRVSRANGSLLDAAFVAALDRQDAARGRGESVLSIVSGDSRATLADWAAWAAGRGYLTLITEGTGVDAAIRDLLAQTPWLQCLAEARRRLAEAAGVEMEAVDATLDARSGDERRRWIDNVAGLDPRVQVSGWLLSVLREGQGAIPNPATAPVQGGKLLSILCQLATPIAVLVQHSAPSASWLEGAISTAATLLSHLPGRSVAVCAPRELVNRVLGSDRQSAALSMARQGMIPVAARRSRPPRAPGRRAKVLHEALARDPRTNGLFELNVQLPIPDEGPDVDVDLVARATRLAIVIEGPSHRADPQRDPRDRGEEARLQRAGYSVRRFPAEDIDQRLALVVHEIAVGIGGSRLG